MRDAAQEHVFLNSQRVRRMAEEIESLKRLAHEQRAELQQAMSELDKARRFSANNVSRLEREMSGHREYGSQLWTVGILKDGFFKGEQFYSFKYGYKLRQLVHVSLVFLRATISFQLMPGHYDSILQWPFTMTVYLTVVHPYDASKDRVKKIDCYKEAQTMATRSPFMRPAAQDENERVGNFVVPLDDLNSDNFFEEDSIFVHISVTRGPDQPPVPPR